MAELDITDIIAVLGEAQTAGEIDPPVFVGLLTRFNAAIRERETQAVAKKVESHTAQQASPSDSTPTRSGDMPVEFRRPRQTPDGIGIEVIPYPPDDTGQEPPLATFREPELNQ